MNHDRLTTAEEIQLSNRADKTTKTNYIHYNANLGQRLG